MSPSAAVQTTRDHQEMPCAAVGFSQREIPMEQPLKWISEAEPLTTRKPKDGHPSTEV